MSARPVRLATVEELMNPRSIAIIGASEDTNKFGGRILRILLDHGFSGEIYPINPLRPELLGRRAYPSIDRTSGPVDLVIMAIPRKHVIDTVDACGKAGVKGAIVVTSQFSEADEEGAAIERQLVQSAHSTGMRIIGPNCIGIISPANNFILCPSPVLLGRTALRGEIGLVSQSGAIMGTMFDRAVSQQIGFSHCISVGNQADLDLCDFVDYLIDDPATKVICSYVEGIKRPARFKETAARARNAGKPWLLIKAGRTEAGAAAAFSHTASLASDHAAFAAICKYYGVVLVDDLEAMLLLAAGMSRFPRHAVQSVAVLSPSGGGCTVAADRLTDLGCSLSSFSSLTRSTLEPSYPAGVHNPVDIGAANDGASMSYTELTHKSVLSDENVDLALTVITAAPNITRFAEMAAKGVATCDKPALMVLLPGRAAEGARSALREMGVLHTDTLDTALRTIASWREWSAYTKPDSPDRPTDLRKLDPPPAGSLNEQQVKAALKEYGIPVNNGRFARTVADTAQAADELQSPYVLKIVSDNISHKTEVGGVTLDLQNRQEVWNAAREMVDNIHAKEPAAVIQGFLVQEFVKGELELLIGIKNDAQFGPMIMVGAGGIFAELLHDVVLAPAPVSVADAKKMLAELRIASILDGIRGRPALDASAVADVVSRLSWLAHDWSETLVELDINPLLVKPAGSGCVAVDGRALLR